LTHLTGAEAAKLSLELSFKVRLCVEGVPHHAQQEEAIRQLLPQGSLFEGFDLHFHNDSEAAFCCVITWSRTPGIQTSLSVLHLEELQDRPRAAWHFAEPAAAEGRRPHTGPVHTLGYEVLLHIDQVTDYRPPTAGSPDWPDRRSFHWWLGFRDDRRLPAARLPVQDRLGPRKRDRSPPGGDRNGCLDNRDQSRPAMPGRHGVRGSQGPAGISGGRCHMPRGHATRQGLPARATRRSRLPSLRESAPDAV
jgi:hypothetical protein